MFLMKSGTFVLGNNLEASWQTKSFVLFLMFMGLSAQLSEQLYLNDYIQDTASSFLKTPY